MNFFGRLLSSDKEQPIRFPNRRIFSGGIQPKDPASDPRYEATKGDIFLPGRSYFSVRIVEMRLAEAGSYIATYLPMCTCFLRYTYGGVIRDLPFIVGHDMIRAALGKDAPPDGAQNIEFKDIFVVRDVPVRPDGLMMYVALCRLADSGFARGMLDMFADVAGAIGGSVVGAGAHAGVDFAKRLGALLGADGVSTRFGNLDGTALGKSGYRIFVGTKIDGLDVDELVLEQGQLRHRRPDGSTATIDDLDYLVVAIEYRSTLVDENLTAVSNLPFHAQWTTVREKLLAGDENVDAAFKDLCLQVARSPDLADADRLALITAYRGQVDLWKQARATTSLKSRSKAKLTTRLMGIERGQDQPVAKLLRSVRAAIGTQTKDMDRLKLHPNAALDDTALARVADVMIDKTRAAEQAVLERASVQLLAATLGDNI
jgi:hypothetical protein